MRFCRICFLYTVIFKWIRLFIRLLAKLQWVSSAAMWCDGAQRQDKGQRAQTEAEEVLSEHEEELLPSEGDGCPGRLWILLLWRYSRPTWARSCAACSGWPCFSGRVGLDDTQTSLPTSNILWICDLNCWHSAPEGYMVIFTKGHAYVKGLKCKVLSDPWLLALDVAEAARRKVIRPRYSFHQHLLPAVPVSNQYRV